MEEGQDVAAVEQSITEAAASPSEMLVHIKDAVEADAALKNALTALGGSMDGVALEVEEPTVVLPLVPTPAPTIGSPVVDSKEALPLVEEKGGLSVLQVVGIVTILLTIPGFYYYKNQEKVNKQMKRMIYGQSQEEHDEEFPAGSQEVPSQSLVAESGRLPSEAHS